MSMIVYRNYDPMLEDADLQTMARVHDSWIWWHVAPALGVVPWRIAYYPSSQAAPAGAYTVNFYTDAGQQQNVLGDHYEDPFGRPIGRVFTAPIRASGGGVLDGIGMTISGTAGHEAAEMLGNPSINRWRQMLDGRETPEEECDAVEGDDYLLTLSVSGLKARVPNFLLPSWFDTFGSAPFDHLGLLTAPFSLRPGGYMLVSSPGGPPTPEWGNQMSEARREQKLLPGSRTARHMAMGAVLPVALPDHTAAELATVVAAMAPPEEPLA